MRIQAILRLSSFFMSGTILSRISGLGRDLFMSFFFGSSESVAAFMVAYRFAYLFRRLLGEGNLAAGFVPIYEEYRAFNPERAECFYRNTLASYTCVMGLVIGGILIGLQGVRWYVGTDQTYILSLMMWMTPGLLWICLSSLNAAYLQCHGRYFLTASSPIALNLVWMVAAWMAYGIEKIDPMKILSIGVVLGLFLQCILMLWGVSSFISLKGPIKLFTSEVRRLIRPMCLGFIGVGAMQINGAIDALFSRIADPKAPAYLWYALRVEQLPLALFGVALAGALLPALSRHVQQGTLGEYRSLLFQGIQSAMHLMIPCTFALFCLAPSGLNLLYGRGAFSEGDLIETIWCLWGYTPSLIPSVCVLLFSTGFYSQSSYFTPARATFLALITNTFCNGLFVFGFGFKGASIALATSVSSCLNAYFLYGSLKKQGHWEVGGLKKLRDIFCLSLLGYLIVEVYYGQGPLSFIGRGELLLQEGLYLQLGAFVRHLILFLLPFSIYLGVRLFPYAKLRKKS